MLNKQTENGKSKAPAKPSTTVGQMQPVSD